MQNEFSSKLLERAVEAFAGLPGIGRKTALRLVLHLLRQNDQTVKDFTLALTNLKENVKYCKECHNISDNEICEICNDRHRDHQTICVVENVQDVMAIENTQQYNGTYHVLGGIISPIDGIGPRDLTLDSLEKRVKEEDIKEVILALSPTTSGETTNFYISRKLAPYSVKLSTIARGVSVGEELEYTDEITLGRSILNRIAFSQPNEIQ